MCDYGYKPMRQIEYEKIVTPELLEGNLDYNAHDGFLYDYRALHCLLRLYKPKTIFEIGTNTGEGVNVMATALPHAKIYSLDLDYETMRKNSKQYPLEANGGDRVGSAVRFPYVQLRGDSMYFQYEKYHPINAWFIDGEHTYDFVAHESKEAKKSNPKIIIYHDTDVTEVEKAIIDCFKFDNEYVLFRVLNTRISYAVR